MKDHRLAGVRLANLKALIDIECNGDRNEAARRIDTGIKNLERYLYGTRDLGDKIASKIEEGFDLGQGYLSMEHKASKPIYYITVKIKGDFLYPFIEATRGVDEIVECSAVLGDFDAILKVEAEEFKFLEIASRKISKMPGVIRTRTYQTIPTLRWQEKQDAGEYIYPQEDSFSNCLEEYIYKNIISCLEEANQWESGEIYIPTNTKAQKHPISLSEIYGSVKSKMCVVRKHTRAKEIDEELFSIETKKISDEKVCSKRIVVLEKEDEDYFLDNYKKLMELEERFSSIGCSVRFILSSQFIPTDLSQTYEHYIIVDDEFVMVVRSQQERIYFKKEPRYVNMYIDSFEESWEEALSVEGLGEKCVKNLA